MGISAAVQQIPTPPGEKNFLEQLREEEDHDPSFVEVLNYLTKVSVYLKAKQLHCNGFNGSRHSTEIGA
jgi:hypothetical protein